MSKKNLKGGFREAKERAKQKFLEFSLKKDQLNGPDQIPGKTNFDPNAGTAPPPTNRMTGGGYGITRMNMDRSADSMPVSMLNRFNYGFPRMSRNFMEATESDPNFKPEK